MTSSAKIGGFHECFGDFGLRDTFQEPIAPNSLQIDQDNLDFPQTINCYNAICNDVIWRNRSCNEIDFAYSYKFLRSVICLSAHCLHRSTDLYAIWHLAVASDL